ncbi:hypothetical protein DX873_17270 [Flagellimonas nanhaiensis]|uniref:Uncharacterized protein n=1 Tax=Flagellimonas nanhaiensis TaxID=2292706 RepID=A0A371JLL7_9FLAO|nr:hypothetical protein DX873_17270 [Allomuricauda nanhaiensis]
MQTNGQQKKCKESIAPVLTIFWCEKDNKKKKALPNNKNMNDIYNFEFHLGVVLWLKLII